MTTALVSINPSPGRVLHQRRIELDPAAPGEQLVQVLASAVGDFRDRSRTWTFALPGPFDYEGGIGSFEGVGKFEGLAGVDLREALASRLGLRPRSIDFVNDAEAYALGEWWSSPHRSDRFVCITLGTGVGSAFLDRGAAVTSGPLVPPHGWAHLLRLDGRPLEQTVSSPALRRAFRSLTGEDVDVAQIADRARVGNDAARAVFGNTMRRLGEALGPWVDAFDATELVVGGSIVRSWDVFGAELCNSLREFAPQTLVRAAAAIEDAPLIGAAVWRARRTTGATGVPSSAASDTSELR